MRDWIFAVIVIMGITVVAYLLGVFTAQALQGVDMMFNNALR